MNGTFWLHYDTAARQYALTVWQVSALVRKHQLPKRKVWGRMAVDDAAWEKLVAELKIPLAKGYSNHVEPRNVPER